VPSEVLPAIISWARERFGDRRLAALGHRVVHGGLHHSRPARVTPELLAELEALVPLAPLHEPHNLAPIKMAMTLDPELPQVACFDTAFRRTAPEVEQAFALPGRVSGWGLSWMKRPIGNTSCASACPTAVSAPM
jgi:acetate kinase